MAGSGRLLDGTGNKADLELIRIRLGRVYTVWTPFRGRAGEWSHPMTGLRWETSRMEKEIMRRSALQMAELLQLIEAGTLEATKAEQAYLRGALDVAVRVMDGR